ncbi:MAG: YdbH domain-containing protein, partial [Brevundimonas sp.]
RIGAARVGDRLALHVVTGGMEGASSGVAFSAEGGVLDAGLVYPKATDQLGRGPATFTLTMRGLDLAAGALSASDAAISLNGDGRLSGPPQTLEFEARAEASLGAASARLGDTRLAALEMTTEGRLTLRREGDVSWRFDGPATVTAERLDGPALDVQRLAVRSSVLTVGGRGSAFEASGPVALSVARMETGDLTLTAAEAGGRLDLVSQNATAAMLDLAIEGRGGWRGFGPVAADDPPEIAALKRSLGDFSLSAPQVRITAVAPGLSVRLNRPLVASPASGGELVVRARTDAPLFDGERQGGAFSVQAGGGGLPTLDLEAPTWGLIRDGFTVDLAGAASLDFAPAEDLRIAGEGRLAANGGRTAFAPSGCLAVTAARLELGENDAEAVSGDLCPAGGTFLSIAGGRWRLSGRVSDVAARLPSFEARADGVAGPIVAVGGEALGLDLQVERATLSDVAEATRFEPLIALGRATLTDEIWTGAFDLSPRARPEIALAQAELRHDGRSGVGGLAVRATEVRFVEGGLQPDDISPIGDDVIKGPVTGRAAFDGRFDWTADAATSRGEARVTDLNFVSPLGPVTNLRTEVSFDSLAPLTTAPGQRLTAEAVAAFAPLNDLTLTFALEPDALVVEGGRVTAAGGIIRAEPFRAPMTPDQPLTGALTFEGVELGEILRTLGLGEDIAIQARVSGRLPFQRLPDGRLRIQDGSLSAIRPGRVSIPRTALDDVAAGGGGPETPPNMVQDLAYQAMENLAYDSLSADLNSTDDGRMLVRFQIRGRHDPPQRQEIRLSIMDLIRRRFMDQPLPLPSGTEIDLTLDLNFNADELFGDLIALDQARRGQTPAAPATP